MYDGEESVDCVEHDIFGMGCDVEHQDEIKYGIRDGPDVDMKVRGIAMRFFMERIRDESHHDWFVKSNNSRLVMCSVGP